MDECNYISRISKILLIINIDGTSSLYFVTVVVGEQSYCRFRENVALLEMT